MKKAIRKIAALLMTLVLAFSALAVTPAFGKTAGKTYAQKQALAYHRHSISLKGVDNARELGGYKTKNGKTVRFGVLLRTAKLTGATAADKKKLLKTYKVTKIIDLRSAAERNAAKDPKLSGVTYVQLSPLGTGIPPVTPTSSEDINALIKASKSGVMDTFMTNEYRDLVADPVAIHEYRQFFQELLKSNGKTVLWHCSGGKDRTGVAALLLLCALGVDEKTAVEDYMNTNAYYAQDMKDAYQTTYQKTHSKQLAKEVRQYYGVNRLWIQVSLNTIRQKYGSVPQYLHNQLGLSGKDLSRLQKAYLK